MHPLLSLAYEAGTQLARLAAAVAPPGDSKIVRSLRARRKIRSRYRAWGSEGRDPSRPLLWMHAPSVGEGLQARPVLQLARDARPELQLAYTFFSPSAERFAAGLDVDFREYLPFDSAGDADAALDALRPAALVFSKLDVWPRLSLRAARRGVRLGMISATLAKGSSRRGGLASAVLRDAYARLDAIGAIDAEDAERLVAVGARRDVIRVTGDTRYDQVWARARATSSDSALLAPIRAPRPTLVAGSTWPSDERHLLPAWTAVRARLPHARLIIAPHEPSEAHLEPIERWAEGERLSIARFGRATAAADVILIDRVGVLGDLYALADVAYVGGGFHAAGLHSVLEPAAFGVPVIFGPRFANSRDADLLLRSGGGATASSTRDIAASAIRWLSDVAARRGAGDAAVALIERGLGAAERSFALVSALIDASAR